MFAHFSCLYPHAPNLDLNISWVGIFVILERVWDAEGGGVRSVRGRSWREEIDFEAEYREQSQQRWT